MVLIIILFSGNSLPFCQFLDGCYCMRICKRVDPYSRTHLKRNYYITLNQGKGTLLLSALEKFASFFQIFNFLRIMATKGDCFPLHTKRSMKKFFSPLQKSHVGTKLASSFLGNLYFSFQERAKTREIKSAYTDSYYQSWERSNITHTYLNF